jgi:molybdenum cofactor synthesis domain
MVTVDEASGLILKHLFQSRGTEVPIESAVGRILAERVTADRDFPPFDRVAMDGIAIRFTEYEKGRREFPIKGVQPAGEPARTLADAEGCLEVMTGAMLPAGTDTVIRYEDISVANGTALVNAEQVSAHQNIHRRGSDAVLGQILLESGTKISPAEVALFAAVGKSLINVYDFPRTALVSSGDELIAVDEKPDPHQIRRSNVYALQAAMMEMGWRANMFHFRDDREELIRGMKGVLGNHDVVILSGGVSKGKFDFIPEALESNGVRKLFHQVSQRPGKPLWFGISDEGKTVFALPGNPVSTYMCFYRYIKPWMEQSLGIEADHRTAILAEDVHVKLPLTYFLQVRVSVESGRMVAYPTPGGGSGDFSNLKDVTGFLELPPSEGGFRRGEVFRYIPFRGS